MVRLSLRLQGYQDASPAVGALLRCVGDAAHPKIYKRQGWAALSSELAMPGSCPCALVVFATTVRVALEPTVPAVTIGDNQIRAANAHHPLA